MTLRLSVSIDGPTASGKTTLGIGLARRFGAVFFDTGLTFRALAYCLARGELDDNDSWRSSIEHLPMIFSGSGSTPGELMNKEVVSYKGQDISELMWGFEVDNKLDFVASSPERRSEILLYHREMLAVHPRTIVAGRDVGITLLPDAGMHVFLTANFAVRRERRRAQYRENPARSVVVGAITRRDVITLEQLRTKPNSVVVDTTYLPRETILTCVEKRLIEGMR
jgi:CMP/dCMP kinase